MNCRRVMNLISAYVDGELAGTEMLAIRRHLSECPECCQEYESVRQVKQALSRLRTVFPRNDLAAAIARRLDEVQVATYQKFYSRAIGFLHGKLSPVAAALAASGVALMFMTAGGIDGLAPQTLRSSVAALGQRTREVAFLRDVSKSQSQFGVTPDLVAASKRPDPSSELQFVSLTR
ncbi:MAG: anti-sigma factor [Armatimonadetes bacterium]|nr:anti-sigma factor [Armatimonadota bacterium]